MKFLGPLLLKLFSVTMIVGAVAVAARAGALAALLPPSAGAPVPEAQVLGSQSAADAPAITPSESLRSDEPDDIVPPTAASADAEEDDAPARTPTELAGVDSDDETLSVSDETWTPEDPDASLDSDNQDIDDEAGEDECEDAQAQDDGISCDD